MDDPDLPAGNPSGPWFPDQIGIWKCWFLRRQEKPETRKKNPGNKDENQQQTQPTLILTQGPNPGHIGGRQVLSPLRHPRSS